MRNDECQNCTKLCHGEMTFTEIGSVLGVSRQACEQVYRRGLRKIAAMWPELREYR